MTRLLLAQQGYACDGVATGQEVVRALQEREYDLLVSDIDMPGNRDLQVIAGLPQLQAGLPVILVTGMPTVETAVRSVGLAVAGYLVKPVESEALLQQVKQAIQQYRCFRAVVESRDRFRRAADELERLETILARPGAAGSRASSEAFIDLVMRNAAQSLVDLKRAMDVMQPGAGPEGRDRQAAARPVVLLEALWETIAVLEKTKSSFKSKELGQLRRRLETLVSGDDSPKEPGVSPTDDHLPARTS